MTRYILIGGDAESFADGGRAFCDELLKGHHKPFKILYCLFASPGRTWNELLLEGQEFFSQFLAPEDFELEIASPAKFTEQVKWVDVIYIKEGETEQLLLNDLNTDKKWVSELKGKTLAGSSVGANAMAKYYYSIHDLKVKEGLALLPIKVICHWRSDYNTSDIHFDEALLKLKDHKEDLPVYKLKEGEFVVIESPTK